MLWNQAKTTPVLGGKSYKFNILFSVMTSPLFSETIHFFKKVCSWKRKIYQISWRLDKLTTNSLLLFWMESTYASLISTRFMSEYGLNVFCPSTLQVPKKFWKENQSIQCHSILAPPRYRKNDILNVGIVILQYYFLQQRILLEYPEKVRRFGLSLERDLSSECLRANLVPACFLQRQASENFFKRPSQLQSLVSELALELVQTLIDTKGAICVLPRAILNVINSQACRGTIFRGFIVHSPKYSTFFLGAIMFGDKLSLEECEFLICEISQCHTPFQCARK